MPRLATEAAWLGDWSLGDQVMLFVTLTFACAVVGWACWMIARDKEAR